MSHAKATFVIFGNRLDDRSDPTPRVYPSVELLCANTIFNVAAATTAFERQNDLQVDLAAVADEAARQVLQAVALSAHPDDVLKALISIGGPSSTDELVQRLQAVIDASTRT